MLALHRGVIVSSDRLTDVIWGGEPPATPLNTMQRHVSYLRQVLGSRNVIVARPPGYLLDPVRAGTDVTAAERLIEESVQATGRTRSPRLVHGQVAQPYRLLLDGDPAGAAQAWARLGCTYDTAMALADTPDEAALREAIGILTGLGARPAARIIRQRLRSLGARSIPAGPRTATRAQPLG